MIAGPRPHSNRLITCSVVWRLPYFRTIGTVSLLLIIRLVVWLVKLVFRKAGERMRLIAIIANFVALGILVFVCHEEMTRSRFDDGEDDLRVIVG